MNGTLVGKRLVLHLVAACAALLIAGCTSTVAPQLPQSIAPSFDGNLATSGLLGFDADGAALITDHARERYNGLIAIYGRAFIPALQPDAGVLPGYAAGTYRIDDEHLAKFVRMQVWKKAGRAPL